MLGLVLATALIAQAAHGAPTNCGELCDQSTGSYGQSWGSHSSYSKQSSYGSHQSYSSGSRGLGATGARIEDLDENAVINTAGLDRPGNWHDEKHYVTDDGKGELNYQAGQTVNNNGYTKYASHSYKYGSHDSHAPLSNSQVLSVSEFNNELQNIRSRIANFMGSYSLGSSSLINSNYLEDFKNKASLISSQLNDVCGQVDIGSSMYQQMQQEIQAFQRQVEERQRQIEASMFQTSSISSSSATHGSLYYPESPRPAPVQRPDNSLYIQQQQQRNEEAISKTQSQISSFYASFNRVDSDVKFQEDLNNQANILTQKLIELNTQAELNQSQRQRIENMKSQYEAYVSSIRERIQEVVRRNQEEEIKRQQRLQQIENERIRLENEEKAKLQQLRLEEDRLRQQEQEAERLRIATEMKRQEEEAENRRRIQALEDEKIRIHNEELNAAQASRQNEFLQIQLNKQQQQLSQLQNVQNVQPSRPQVTGSVQVSGTSSVHHTISGSYGSSGNSHSTGAYIKPQPVVLERHVDLTAAVNRLQQELNRVQSEVNKFNSYRMRLTASNSASIANEARQKYEQLHQNLENICETSNSYNNQNILNSAQELQRHFETLYQNFKQQAESYTVGSSQASVSGGYSSSSSYGSSGSFQQVKQPKISNIEYTHEKSTDIEIGSSRRPAQHYSSGSSGSSYSQSSGYRSYGAGADDSFRTGSLDLGSGAYSSDIDCVEQQAGQPCLVPARRHRRNVEDYGPFYNQPDNAQRPEGFSQKYVIPSLDDFQNTGRVELPRDHQPLRNSQYRSRVDDLTRQHGEVDDYYRRGQQEYDNLNQQHVSNGQNEELDTLQRPRSQDVDGLGHRSSGRVHTGSSHQSGEFTLENSGFNDYNKPTRRSNLNSFTTTPETTQGHSQDFTFENSGFNDEAKPLASGNLQLSQQTEDHTQQQNNFDASSVRNKHLENSNDFGVGDLTQQAPSLVEFGSESQVGRAISSEDMHNKPERSYKQNNSQESQILQVGDKNKGSTEQYNENLSQQHQSSDNAQRFGSDSGRRIESANSQTDKTYAGTENQGFISTIRPTVRPAPKPKPRYFRPWQVNNINTTPKQTENEQRSSENQNTNIESSTPKSVQPLRGDLPGHSESTTSELTTPSFYENIPVTTERVTPEPSFYENITVTSEKPKTTPKPHDCFGLGQQHEQVDININNESYGLQNSRNDWMQSSNEKNDFGELGRDYHFNQHHSFHHNYSYTQNFNDLNKQRSNINSGQRVQNSLNRQNNPFETQSQTSGYGLEQSTYRFHQEHLSHSQYEQSSQSNHDLRPENSHSLESTSQNIFNQQSQFPSFEQTGQYEFGQQYEINQRTEDLLAAGVIPIDETRPFNTWQDGTTPSTFWKRIGHKLSRSYDKAKEKAKNIFG